MKTVLSVSCPYCGKETGIAMELQHDTLPELDNLLSCIAPHTKRYSFDGKAQCACGKLVIATLTVTGGSIE